MFKFEKVSYEEFKNSIKKLYMLSVTEEEIKDMYDNIRLPKRGSKGSAGYDFFSPIAFEIKEEDFKDTTIVVPTGIRAIMPQDICLKIVPRSGVGFKTGAHLANTVGIIDSDYYASPNEGHILLKLVSGFGHLTVNRGDRVVQGIFEKYYITDDDDVEEIREGGLGSTGN